MYWVGVKSTPCHGQLYFCLMLIFKIYSHKKCVLTLIFCKQYKMSRSPATRQEWLEWTSLLRQNILKNYYVAVPSTYVLFYWLKRKLSSRAFQPINFLLKNCKYFKSYHGKTKILKRRPFFKKTPSFVTMLLLVIARINYLTHNNTCYHCVTTVTTVNSP